MNNEIRQAHREIESSRRQMEEAFDEMEVRIRETARQAREIGFKALDTFRSTEGFVKENSIPVAALVLIGGYMVGTRINQMSRQRQQEQNLVHGTEGGEIPRIPSQQPSRVTAHASESDIKFKSAL